MSTKHILIGKEKLPEEEIQNRIIIGEALVRARRSSLDEYRRLQAHYKINDVKAYRYTIVAEFVSLMNKGLFRDEYVARTNWSTLVALASKPEDVEEHRMLLHLIHYAMLRKDRGLPVSEYSLPTDSTTVHYVLKNKDKNYIRAMYARSLFEASVDLDAQQRQWLELPWEPLVIEKNKKIANIADAITDDLEEQLNLNFEQDGAKFPVQTDLAFAEPGKESSVLKVFAAQQNGSSDDIKEVIQEQLEKYFGITAPDAEEMKRLQDENQALRNTLYSVLQEIRTIHNTIAEAGIAAQMFIEATNQIDLQNLKNTISDTLNK
jgi:hypothetical protein